MNQESVIFAAAIFVVAVRYLISWIASGPWPDLELVIGILTLATALKFGENKAQKLKTVFQKIKVRFSK